MLGNPNEKIDMIVDIVHEIVAHLRELFESQSEREPYFNETLEGIYKRKGGFDIE